MSRVSLERMQPPPQEREPLRFYTGAKVNACVYSTSRNVRTYGIMPVRGERGELTAHSKSWVTLCRSWCNLDSRRDFSSVANRGREKDGEKERERPEKRGGRVATSIMLKETFMYTYLLNIFSKPYTRIKLVLVDDIEELRKRTVRCE